MNTLLFKYIPRRMKIEFIYFVTLWINFFPVKSGVSDTFSPREILLCWRMDAKKHCRVLPGSYCEVNDELNPSNTTGPRRMKIEFIYFVTLWLNAFPVKSGGSETFYLRKILLRWRMDSKKHCRVLPVS